MLNVAIGAAILIVGFVIGLLVGRKNPSIADATNKVIAEARAKAEPAVTSQVDQVINAVKEHLNKSPSA